MKFCDYFSVVLQIVAGYFATWFKMFKNVLFQITY